jgi:hypothetical protein
MSIEDEYRDQLAMATDIVEHLPTLRELAAECSHVTEFGMRFGCSTTALLAAQPESLISYDIQRTPDILRLQRAAGKTRFVFHHVSTLDAEIEPTELLFIDTVHTCFQVYGELTRHAHKVSRYLVFHDTMTCGERDYFYTEQPAGLLYGIGRYMSEHPGEWKQAAHYPNCNGLTVYKRVKVCRHTTT